jgi:hypothetical protein
LDLGLDLTLAVGLLRAAPASLRLRAFIRVLDFFPNYPVDTTTAICCIYGA